MGGAEQRWKEVKWGSGGLGVWGSGSLFPEKSLEIPPFYIVGKRPFLKRFTTLRPYLFTVRFQKDFKKICKDIVMASKINNYFLHFLSQKKPLLLKVCQSNI